jgi:glycosyltransferase involved in cell wall biosynthesis
VDSKQIPLVSIIIATYNSGAFIAQAVQSALEQTYGRYEVLIIDDGSTDKTQSVLDVFHDRITYMYQQNGGPSAARNLGLTVAQGEYICFLDADDLWIPNKLEVQLAFMECHPDIGLVFSDEEEIEDKRVLCGSLLVRSKFYPAITSQIPIQKACMKLLIENFVPTSTVMVRKECFVKVGLFDESLRVSEDRDMWSRIAAYFGIACVPLILGKKRAHQHNISSNSALTLRSRIRVWEKARHLFPHLVPATVLDNLLADAHLQLGYIMLTKDQREEARQHGWKSLVYAAKHITIRERLDKSLPSYRWFFCVGLILFTYMGWPMTRLLWQTKNTLLTTLLSWDKAGLYKIRSQKRMCESPSKEHE